MKGSADSWFFNVVDATSDLIVVGHNSFYRFRVTDHDDDDIVFSRQLVSDDDDDVGWIGNEDARFPGFLRWKLR